MQEIYSTEEWDEVLEQSSKEPVLLLKHSSTCPVSAAGFNAFQKAETGIPKYFMIVQKSRPLSLQIEQDLEVRHESPQLFLLKDGKAAWQATHYSIRAAAITKAIEELQN